MRKTTERHAGDVLRRPLLTEKGTALGDREASYLFEVAMAATKPEIKRAVEQLFAVSVERVGTQVVRGKYKRVGRNVGRRPNWKKAIVRLSAGQKIDFFAAS